MQFNNKKKFDFGKYMVYVIFAFCLIIFGIWLQGKFFTLNNLLNITRQAGAISVMAIGMMFVIALGHIDLSIGSIVAVSSLFAAYILRDVGNPALAVVVAIGFGAAIGMINGLCVTVIRMPAFLTTLGTQAILSGVAMWISGTKAVPVTNSGFLFWFGSGMIGEIPILLIWALATTIIGHIVLSNTSYGRKVLATGGNKLSAQYSGVKVNKITMMAFISSGALAGLSGILYAGRAQSARWDFGSGVEMNVIAAVVLGGTAMSGGTGSAIGAFVGSLLIMMINNGLVIGGLGVAQQTLMRGVIIIIAVALSELSRMKKKGR